MVIPAKPYEAIALDALSLPTPERRDLVDRLLRSLDDDIYDDSENIKVAVDRLQRVQSGEDRTISYEEFRQHIRSHHGL